MSHNLYCEEERLIISKLYSSRGWRVTQAALKGAGYDRSMYSICRQAKLMGIRGSVKRWTKYEDWLMREYYPFEGLQGMRIMLRTWGFTRSKAAVKNRANNLGIKCLFNHGRYSPGQEPPNKGKKMSAEVYAKVSATMFKKGSKPHNTKQDNAISIRKDNSGYEYKYIRISEGNWKLLHRVVWEDANGLIPRDHVIVFKDRDQMNCHIDNLECISKKENMERNRNVEKATVTLRSLTDNYIAGRIAQKDRKLKKQLLTMPDLLELQRQKMLINREINDKIKRAKKPGTKNKDSRTRSNT